MAFDRNFAEQVVAVMLEDGWGTWLPQGNLSNPLYLSFAKDTQTRQFIIHARRLTHQASPTSSHHRPVGEMHMQMIFDDSRRGAGVRNHLPFADAAETLLFGFYQIGNDYVIAAYDPQRHREYAYSKSLQVKFRTLQEAHRTGMAFQVRTNGEIVVAFHISQIGEYFDHASEWHNLTSDAIDTIREEVPQHIQPAFEQTEDAPLPPLLASEERKQRTQEITRYIRNYRFTEGIKNVYSRCAICGFQYDDVLDAAHIVPVAAGGTDTFNNGLGLCPNCHRMFDRGLVLVDGAGNIFLNPHLAETYQEVGRADSLEHLQTILRDQLWLPNDEQYHPSAENLRRTFEARNKPKPDF